MKPKNIVLLIVLFVLIFLSLTAAMGFSMHLPLIGRLIGGFFAMLLIGFVVLVFVIAAKKK